MQINSENKREIYEIELTAFECIEGSHLNELQWSMIIIITTTPMQYLFQRLYSCKYLLGKKILSDRSCVVVLMYDFPKASLGQKVTFLIINKYSHCLLT